MTTISLTILDNDPSEVDRLSRLLRTELLSLDVDRVELVHDTHVPEAAKSDLATVTALVVAVTGSPVLVQLGRVLRDWVNRNNARKILVRDGDRSIEITGYDQKSIEAFLNGKNEET